MFFRLVIFFLQKNVFFMCWNKETNLADGVMVGALEKEVLVHEDVVWGLGLEGEAEEDGEVFVASGD